MTANPYETDLDRNPANFVALTPLSFIERTAAVYPDRVAIIHGSFRQTWRQTYERCRRLASALAGMGLGPGDTVSIMLPNIPAMCEVHFGVPMCGAVLNTLNTRLDAESIAFMLKHSGAKVLITDREYSQTMTQALDMLEHKPLVVDVDDPLFEGGRAIGSLDYEALLARGDPDWAWPWPADEWQAISLNYTSGTTGDPKGVGPCPCFTAMAGVFPGLWPPMQAPMCAFVVLMLCPSSTPSATTRSRTTAAHRLCSRC